ncbi:MAG: AI-2E family transporter [Bdellovibrionia bacterium]
MPKIKIVEIAIITILGLLLLFINWPFFMPLLIASIFALGTRNTVLSLAKKAKISYAKAVYLFIAMALLLFWIPLSVATYRAFMVIKKMGEISTSGVHERANLLLAWILEKISLLSDVLSVDLLTPATELFEKGIGLGSTWILATASGFFQHLPSLFIGSTVFVFAWLYLLLNADYLKKLVHERQWMLAETFEKVVKALKISCSTTLFSTIIIGLVQASIIGLGSLIFDQGDFWLITIITFFISFIPVLGAAPLGFLLAGLAFVEGAFGSGIGLIIFAVVAGLIDNILKPFMVGSVVKAPAILAFTSVIGAIIMLGIPGLLLGPVIMNMALLVIPIMNDNV